MSIGAFKGKSFLELGTANPQVIVMAFHDGRHGEAPVSYTHLDVYKRQVENQVVDWMRTLFGFPSEATGLFVTGTSMASFIAMVVARDARLGCDVRRQGIGQATQKLTAYASTAVHGSIGRALDFAGLGSEALRLVAVDSRQRIDLIALKKACLLYTSRCV